jgi:transitional endoplasmic reticulum ATPase
MADTKAALTEAVLWPLQYPDTFARLGVAPPRGLLLYGPPGCGKTFLVKALAGSGQANVLSVKGAELLSKWVGESERAVRELFRRARESAPSLIFLDEIDALAPVRGQSSDGGTDRPRRRGPAHRARRRRGPARRLGDRRDQPARAGRPAMLRPGRLERLVFVPPPDAEAARRACGLVEGVPARDRRRPDRGRRAHRGLLRRRLAALVREAALTRCASRWRRRP